jgi:Zn-dependent protease with chaperone function
MSASALALFLAALPMAWAEKPAMTLQADMKPTGEVTILVSPPQPGPQFARDLAAVIQCQARMISTDKEFDNFLCSNGMRRDGLSLEAVFDLAPIARTRAPTDEIELWMGHPRLGFESSSIALLDQGAQSRVVRRAQFPAGALPGPIRIQFGYRTDQLTAIFLPLAALALALLVIAISLAGAGLAELNRSVFLLGTMFWLAIASRLQVSDALNILLFGTPLGNIAGIILGILVKFCTPLLCVAAGTALGGRKRTERRSVEIFAEFVWTYGMILFPLTAALAAVPSMAEGDWMRAAPWLVAAPLSLLVCRWRMRANVGSSVWHLSRGDLKDRVSEMAAKAGRGDVQVYISSSSRSRVLNAFALLRNRILLTAPLVQSLTKREVDAVVAHELSHLGHTRRSPWAALGISVVLCQTPLADMLVPWTGGLFLVMFVPLAVYVAALRGARKREFAADAGSVALTGDPRALISGLARIARHNKKALEYPRMAEWFSTHPATIKRLRALAAAGKLQPGELEALSGSDVPGESYVLPPEESGVIFNLAWQTANAKRYVWTTLLGSAVAGLLVAGVLNEYAGPGFPQLVGGIVLGCAITKMLAASVMAGGYAQLRRKLVRKLGISGQLVGLAVDSEPRVYSGYRFSDAGFLSFNSGRLCYRSERIAMELNPADVLEVSIVAAAPASWRRLQPMVRFRHGDSFAYSFILHPVELCATPRRLLQSIQQWRAAGTSVEPTSISGFQAIPGQPYRVPTIAQTARGFRIPGAVTLVGTVLAGWPIRGDWWPICLALAVTASAHIFMFLPAMLYRSSSPRPVVTSRAGAE